MLNIVVFSKNRANQLDLFLRSMKFYFKEFEKSTINVLYTYSNDSFKRGYDKLIEYNIDDNINFIEEDIAFKKAVLLLIDNQNPYTVFFVDDIVFKNDFTLESNEFKLFKSNNDILTLSLRLNSNLTYCYAASRPMNPPIFNSDYTYDWLGKQGDYGYPMSLDGHFFKTPDIVKITKQIIFDNPNSYESMLSFYPILKPKIIIFKESVIFNNPINKVQNFNNNIHGDIDAHYLNESFLNGWKIDLEPYKGMVNESCHKEMPINLIKIEDYVEIVLPPYDELDDNGNYIEKINK